MATRKTLEKDIHIYFKDKGSLNKASKRAKKEALFIHGIDEDGHSKYGDDFPRSESEIVIEFIGMRVTMGMNGEGTFYKFKTWMERAED